MRLLSALLLLSSLWVRAQPVSFEHSIQPILAERCQACHSDRNASGRLSLTSVPALLRGGQSGAAVIAGKPDESLLLQTVSGDKPRMPKVGAPLSPDQIALLRRWIAEGARNDSTSGKQETWWSLKPLARPLVPSFGTGNPIDAFVGEKLAAAGLPLSPEADRRTLIRRLYYDLHGLPPTIEDISAFERDQAPGAYERLVDRLLASPRYGERWARHWLDVIHYGESHGYDKDKPRLNAWPYRDYVIRSFNEDKP